jgi:PBP1b-binding outer membrane lipoprotein LpoB
MNMHNRAIFVLLLILSAFLTGCSHPGPDSFSSMSRADQTNAMKADPSKMTPEEKARIKAAMAQLKSRPVQGATAQ